MNRLSLYLLPVIAIFAVACGLTWGWIGIRAAIGGGGPVAYLFIVFGFGGIVLGMALWRARQALLKRST